MFVWLVCDKFRCHKVFKDYDRAADFVQKKWPEIVMGKNSFHWILPKTPEQETGLFPGLVEDEITVKIIPFKVD